VDQPLVAVALSRTRRASPAIRTITHFHPISPLLLPPTHHSTAPKFCTTHLAHSLISHYHQALPQDKMGSKRKRSDDDSPLSVSSYGAFSTPEAQSPIPFPRSFDGAMDVDTSSRHTGWDFARASRVKSSDWGNRTRKRFRDNRPDENAIHRTFHVKFLCFCIVLTAPRKHATKALLCTTVPPRRFARAFRPGPGSTARSSHLKAAEVNPAFLLEAAPRTASPAYLLCTAAGAIAGCTATTLRRLRHTTAKRQRQHGCGHGHGRCCREQSLRMH
jgi:hypothetical protein